MHAESTMDDKPLPVSMHTDCISNSVVLGNNYVSLLSALCACRQENDIANEAIVVQ